MAVQPHIRKHNRKAPRLRCVKCGHSFASPVDRLYIGEFQSVCADALACARRRPAARRAA